MLPVQPSEIAVFLHIKMVSRLAIFRVGFPPGISSGIRAGIISRGWMLLRAKHCCVVGSLDVSSAGSGNYATLSSISFRDIIHRLYLLNHSRIYLQHFIPTKCHVLFSGHLTYTNFGYYSIEILMHVNLYAIR